MGHSELQYRLASSVGALLVATTLACADLSRAAESTDAESGTAPVEAVRDVSPADAARPDGSVVGDCSSIALNSADAGTLVDSNGPAPRDASNVDGLSPTDLSAPDAPPVRAPAAPGDLVISEIMVDPNVAVERNGEWIELYNPSEDITYQLAGCMLHDDGRDHHVIASPLLVAPGSHVTLASSGDLAQTGFAPDYAYDSFLLSNSGDEVVISCGDIEIDRVVIDTGAFPHPSGASLSLDPAAYDAQENDSGTAWCAGRDVYNPAGADEGDRGTPGEANPPCPHDG